MYRLGKVGVCNLCGGGVRPLLRKSREAERLYRGRRAENLCRRSRGDGFRVGPEWGEQR